MYPHKVSKHNKSMTYDENMYRFPNSNHMRLATAKAKKVIQIELTSNWHYSQKGDVQVILNCDKKCIEIHKLIESHKTPIKQENIIGIDKGLYTLISCSSGHEYGIGYSKYSNANAEWMSNKNGNRHKNYIDNKMPTAKHYRRQRDGKRAHLKSLIDHAVRQMFFKEHPSLIVKEDLSFTKDKLPKAKNKWVAKQRRNLATWAKGMLNERIEYYCDKFNVPFVDINPAYTSQYCPICGIKFLRREGKHHEIAVCPNCGKMNANIAAAKNVKKRKDDSEINLYTPYKEVKKILDSRI